MGKWDGGKLYWFFFLFSKLLCLCYIWLLGRIRKREEKIWLLNENGIQFLGMFEQFVLFNGVYMRFEMFCCLMLFIWDSKKSRLSDFL